MAAADRTWIPASTFSRHLTILGNPPQAGYAQSLSVAKHASNH
jgi:hypothetical protein